MIKGYAAVITILLALLVPSALTEPLPPAATSVVGHTGNGEHIHAYDADNGQTLYFTSPLKNPSVMQEDVNFDGADDIVVCTASDGDNAFSIFFVYVNGMYVLAEHPGLDEPLCNYQLHPETCHVVSHSNQGMSGLLHDTCIFAWEGPHLRLLRRATTKIHSDDANASPSKRNHIHFSVTHYTPDRFNGFVVWEKVMDHTLDDINSMLSQENEYLLHSLK